MIARDVGHPGQLLPPKEGHVSGGRFERILKAGKFVVTAELAPPDSALAEDVYERARIRWLCRRHECYRWLGCELSYVECRDVRVVD